MSYDREIYTKATQRLTKLRQDNEGRARRQKLELYHRLPRVYELDGIMDKIGFDMLRAVHGGMPAAEAAEKIAHRNNRLETERTALLKKNGLPPDYGEIKYLCEKCRDTGQAPEGQCICLKNLLIDEAYKASNISAIVGDNDFGNFDLTYYSDVSSAAISDRKNMERVLAECIRFAENFPDGNLIMEGAPGLGKTFLSGCIATEIIRKGYTVLYNTASALFSILEKNRFNPGEGAEYIAQRMNDVDLLIIDDLGTEFITAFSRSELFRVINGRLMADKSTIINSNLSFGQLSDTYSERILSRITGNYLRLHFQGEDIRIQKRFKRNQ